MKALKRLIAIVGGGIVGLVLVYFGVKEVLQSKALRSKGKSVVAEVTDAEERSGRRGRKKFYVSVDYKTEAGQEYKARQTVSRAVFDEATNGGKVSVTYLPTDPAVVRVGPVKTEWWNIGIGIFVLGCAGVSAIRGDE